MKITVELKDEKFYFDYYISENQKGQGEQPIGVRTLELFTSLLTCCYRVYNERTAKEIKDIECMAYIEKHPELIKKYKNNKG